jgi:hypothetical protein
MTAALTRLGALLCVSILAQAITTLAWLPYTIVKLGAVFDVESYLLIHLIFKALLLSGSNLFWPYSKSL